MRARAAPDADAISRSMRTNAIVTEQRRDGMTHLDLSDERGYGGVFGLGGGLQPLEREA